MGETRPLRLRYTLPALTDLATILDHIATNSPLGARRVQARIQAVVGLLGHQPNIGRRTDDPAIRRVVVTPYPYLIFYEPTDAEIVIHAVRHGARDPSSMPGSNPSDA